MGDDDLLTKSVVGVVLAALAFAAPHADQGEKSQERVVQAGAESEVGGVGEAGRSSKTGMLRLAVSWHARPPRLGPDHRCPRLGLDHRCPQGHDHRCPRGCRRTSRLVSDQPVDRIERKPGDHHGGDDQQDLEEEHHGRGVSLSRRARDLDVDLVQTGTGWRDGGLPAES